MAWISQLVPVRPSGVADSPNLKVGAAILEKVTQVHLFSTVIPVAGSTTALVVTPEVNSILRVASPPHMSLAYGQPTWASSFLLLLPFGMSCWAFRRMAAPVLTFL